MSCRSLHRSAPGDASLAAHALRNKTFTTNPVDAVNDDYWDVDLAPVYSDDGEAPGADRDIASRHLRPLTALGAAAGGAIVIALVMSVVMVSNESKRSVVVVDPSLPVTSSTAVATTSTTQPTVISPRLNPPPTTTPVTPATASTESTPVPPPPAAATVTPEPTVLVTPRPGYLFPRLFPRRQVIPP